VRSRIMPVNRKYPLKILLEACDYYVAKRRRLTFEYMRQNSGISRTAVREMEQSPFTASDDFLVGSFLPS
jgi:hypothetical protein